LAFDLNVYCQTFEYLEKFIIEVIYCSSLIPIADVILLTIGAIDRSDPQVLTANFAFVGETYGLLVISTSATIALESAEDDGGASASDTHCTDKPD
jgi:hypothetical protein